MSPCPFRCSQTKSLNFVTELRITTRYISDALFHLYCYVKKPSGCFTIVQSVGGIMPRLDLNPEACNT